MTFQTDLDKFIANNRARVGTQPEKHKCDACGAMRYVEELVRDENEMLVCWEHDDCDVIL